MAYFWVKFTTGYPAFIDAKNEDHARAEAATLSKREVKEIFTLPYPAEPQLNTTDCQPFCYTPEMCKGHTCCPKNYACTE
jgi:hypothetical protein